jgi:hypothetical protein
MLYSAIRTYEPTAIAGFAVVRRGLLAAPSDQRILAAGSLAGAWTSTRWRRARAGCSVNRAVALSAPAVPREAL